MPATRYKARMFARHAAALVASTAAFAHAAGGHHAVDDATVMEPNQCLLETWADAFRGGNGSWHVGPACRVGAWELGLGIDRAGLPGTKTQHIFSPQTKWAMPITPTVSIGAEFAAVFEEGRYSSFQPLVPVTWQPDSQVLFHANLGRDMPRGRMGSGRTLAGAAMEWTPPMTWSFVLERFNDATGRATRVGTRWQPTPLFSIDVSRAHAFGSDPRRSWWTVGASYAIDRK